MTAVELSAAHKYASPRMPQPASADGPWGEAIKYWLRERKWLQADLVRKTGLGTNTISRCARGFHTNTRMLEIIATAFGVPIDQVLISPERKRANEDRRRIAGLFLDDLLSRMEAKNLDIATILDANFRQQDQIVRSEEASDIRRRRKKRGTRKKTPRST